MLHISSWVFILPALYTLYLEQYSFSMWVFGLLISSVWYHNTYTQIAKIADQIMIYGSFSHFIVMFEGTLHGYISFISYIVGCGIIYYFCNMFLRIQLPKRFHACSMHIGAALAIVYAFTHL